MTTTTETDPELLRGLQAYAAKLRHELRVQVAAIRRLKAQQPKRPSKVETKQCEICGREFMPKRSDQKFCGSSCRVKRFRAFSDRYGYSEPKPEPLPVTASHVCLCGRPAVKRSSGQWACATCLRIEANNARFEEKRARRHAMLEGDHVNAASL